MIRVAAVQMRSGVRPGPNLEAIGDLAADAAAQGAQYILTPEVSVAFAPDRAGLAEVAGPYEGNEALDRLSGTARALCVHLHVGSLAVALPDGHFANRSVLFGPDGAVVATYDKIHLFDADVPGDRGYRESATYRGGGTAIVTRAAGFALGFSVCYDLRFPALYTALAEGGAEVIAVPAAFTEPTGRAHWETLLRARAIETGTFVIAAAQGGRHENGRVTYGHSMIVDPWGEILAEADHDMPGVIVADIDLERVAQARRQVPALANRRGFSVSVNPEVQK